MRVDFSPLFRSTVGFDHLSRVLDSALQQSDEALSYPPYNIEKLSDDAYRITMAVAGFTEADLEIVAADNVLTVKGRLAKDDDAKRVFLHRGIAGRAFERRFNLADHIKVNGASLQHGLLQISLVREVPESLKPRRVEIKAAGQPQQLEQQAA